MSGLTDGRSAGTADDVRAGLPPLPRTAWLEIDLDALTNNLGVIRALAGDGIPVHAVVKADAYGHGAVPVARSLETAGADGFCVAAYDEAIALRAGGIRAPILVLYPIPVGWVVDAARRAVAITAGDQDLLAAALAEVERAQPRRALRIQLEVETGLGRGGFRSGELVAAARAIRATRGARISGLWTHLQAPEDPANVATQLGRFEAAVGALRAARVRVPARHFLASGSLVAGAGPMAAGAGAGAGVGTAMPWDGVASFDGVRPGLSLYGLIPDELGHGSISPAAHRLRPALSLRARAVRVADLERGWGISYGPTFRTDRPSRIATLPLGYGDGWSRALSNRAEALVRGVRVPTVGNVAMDAVMVDVTDVPGPPVTVADTFTLIGRDGLEEIAVADVARARATNAWEVVTSFARRMPRVYHAAAGPVAVRTLVSGGRG